MSGKIDSPLQVASGLYKDGPGDFVTDLAWHLRHGVVYSGPDAFVMGRPVCWEQDDLLNPSMPCRGVADTWFVWLAVGRQAVRRALEICPYPLKYAAWQRRGGGRMRRYTMERLVRTTKGHTT